MPCEQCKTKNTVCENCIESTEWEKDDIFEDHTISSLEIQLIRNKDELTRMSKVITDLIQKRDRELDKINYIYEYKLNKVKVLCSDLTFDNFKLEEMIKS